MRRLAWAGLSGALAVAIACSPFSADTSSSGGPTPTPTTGPGVEPEGGVPPGGGGPDGATPNGGFPGCGSQHDLCLDFESDAGTMWRSSPSVIDYTNPEMRLVQDDTGAQHATVLRISVPAASNGKEGRAWMEWSRTPKRAVHLSADIRVAKPSANGGHAAILGIYLGTEDPSSAQLEFVPNGEIRGYLYDGKADNGQATDVRMPFPFDQWVHVDIRVDLVPKVGSATTTAHFQTDKGWSSDATMTRPVSIAGDDVTRIGLGVFRFKEGAPAVAALYDNVVVDLE